MVNERLQAIRQNVHTGERSCRWCRRELSGDHDELLHVMCAPAVAQVDLLRRDMAELASARRYGWFFASGACVSLVSAVTLEGVHWLDVVLVVEFLVALFFYRWTYEDQLRLTRGMWRKTRQQVLGSP